MAAVRSRRNIFTAGISRTGRHGLAFVACTLVLVAAATASAASASSNPQPLLVGQTGPGFTISLQQGGKPVTTLKAGVYTVRVLDKSSIHNFRITGPGVNMATSVAKVYTVTWTVTLKKGTYVYLCDPHPEVMRGSFKVS
jgi:plastocyanin